LLWWWWWWWWWWWLLLLLLLHVGKGHSASFSHPSLCTRQRSFVARMTLSDCRALSSRGPNESLHIAVELLQHDKHWQQLRACLRRRVASL
jgi:hypothetical protein